MSWFLRDDTVAGAPDAKVAVRAAQGDKAVGAGVLLAPGLVLTCAHVVNDALQRSPFDMSLPGHHPVRVGFRTHAWQVHEAHVAYWIPPRRTDDGGPVRAGVDSNWLGDLAVLRLVADARQLPSPPRRVGMARRQAVRAWHGGAHESTFADGRVTSFDGRFGYVDGFATGMAIGPAYSGGPLWAHDQEAWTGLVAAAHPPRTDPHTGRPATYHPQDLSRRSWAIPWQRIEAELRAVGALDSLPDEEPDPHHPAFVLLADALTSTFPSPETRLTAALDLARTCDAAPSSTVTAPTVDEFVQFLLTEPRALADFSGTLRLRDPSAADTALEAARIATRPRLLSRRELAQLHRYLSVLGPQVTGRLAEAARAALPKAAGRLDGATLDALLDQVEPLDGDSRSPEGEPRVPGLLRVIEYLAATYSPSEQISLRMWVSNVAARLGIPRAALFERRTDAEEWAKERRGRSDRARLLVEITRAGRERFRLRTWCDEGEGPRRLSTDSTTTYSGAEAARELLRILASLTLSGPAGRRPMVEALVDMDGLNLPVDEWEGSGPDDLVPGILGAEFPLVVHCPELLRKHERFVPEWRRRWQRLDSGTTLRFSGTGVDKLSAYGRLMDETDAVRVRVDVPAAVRDDIVRMCLAVGVPVVVWDRRPEHGSHALEHTDDVETRDLPEGVRAYRAKSVSTPADHPGRPVLAWADADRAVPRLHLAEPREGPG
ncbi:trypsin-like peptidase domain-containing protein [Streptomyces sp. VRA16 Mangrove soil]|uniref:VMAP-C domain-containing protein n=1 Tax=Streptomyces sp. VRA16 Mangrove soil TaxID=2817434 RepID=UPI001A9E0EE7|nr:trypsin-like peptidase domain-containing protein [Streptomyces sp. VRA16 Mangrove soil]MBO1330900.1 trypsin-like peptidase domain-containing protein [Streptomyces sp. VRA16 Mangrove soil]